MKVFTDLEDLKNKTELALFELYGDLGRHYAKVTSEDLVEQVEIVIHGGVIAVAIWELKPALASTFTRVLKSYHYDDAHKYAKIDHAREHYEKVIANACRKRREALTKTTTIKTGMAS